MKPLQLWRPHLIVMIGIPGSGKTFFADHFAQTFGVPQVNLGAIRTLISSAPTYDQDEDEIVRATGSYLLNELLRTRQTIILEGGGDTRAKRIELAKTAKGIGYETLFVWVQTEPGAARQRATSANKDTMPLSDELFETLEQEFEFPTEKEPVVVISGKHTYATQLKAVLRRLSARPRTTGIADRQK